MTATATPIRAGRREWIGLAVIATVTLAVICYPVAYGLAKLFGRWANLVTLLMVLPLFVSENLRLYGWILFFIKGGVLPGTLKALEQARDASPNSDDGKKMADQATIIVEMINKYYPELTQSPKCSEDLRIPCI